MVPGWSETRHIAKMTKKKFLIECWDEDKFKSDDFMGTRTVSKSMQRWGI